ncbi:MAG: E3 binding domain-containing protein [Chloroflexi bacterium]|nr:E3 binding domain-containing protein [Chloroflexota bacterium]
MPKQVLVPPLGTTVDTVTLVSWYKQEGEAVRKGEPLFVIETDKANLDIESPANGTLRGVTASEGDEVKALSVIAYISEEGEVLPLVEEAPTKAGGVSAAPQLIIQPMKPVVKSDKTRRIFISPRARRLAEGNRVPIVEIKPSGPEGAIIERDVRLWLSEHTAAVEVTTAPEKAQHEPIAALPAGARAAERFVFTVEIDVTRMVAWRARLLANKLQPSYTSLVLYIAGRLLAASPLQCKTGVSLELAVAVPADESFRYVPIEQAGVLSMAKLTAFEQQASTTGSDSPEFQTDSGSLLAVLDVGGYELDTYSLTAQEPVCALLCLGRMRNQGDRMVAWLSLTADSAKIGNLQAAQFMRELVRLIENPELLLGI